MIGYRCQLQGSPGREMKPGGRNLNRALYESQNERRFQILAISSINISYHADSFRHYSGINLRTEKNPGLLP